MPFKAVIKNPLGFFPGVELPAHLGQSTSSFIHSQCPCLLAEVTTKHMANRGSVHNLAQGHRHYINFLAGDIWDTPPMDGSEQPMLGESIPTPSLGNPALLGGFAALCSWVRAAGCPAHTSRPGRTALRKGCWGKRQIPALLGCCWCSSPLPQPQRKGQEGK